jgi:hypothetical protein
MALYRYWPALLGAVAVALPGLVVGQSSESSRPDRSTWLSLMVGPAPYDIGRTGTGVAAALRFEFPSGKIWVVEPAVGVLRYTSRLGDKITYFLPEVSLQVQPFSRNVRPYLGAGGGIAEYLSGRGTTFGTLHGTAGVRIRFGQWGIRGEARIRTIDPFAQTTTELTVGVSKRI